MPIRSRWHRSARERVAHHRGFTILELLVVVGLIALLVGTFLVGAGEWAERGKRLETETKLKALEGIVDAYHTDLDRYFPDTITNMDEFIREVESVGDIYTAMGEVRSYDADDDEFFVDGGWSQWGDNNRIRFRNPRALPLVTDRQRPWFWSFGPDGANDSVNGNPIQGDDIGSASAPTP